MNHADKMAKSGATYGPVDQCHETSENMTNSAVVICIAYHIETRD